MAGSRVASTVLVVAGLMLSACASATTASVATVGTSASAPRAALPMPTDAKSVATIEAFATGLDDGTALSQAVPGSPAAIYADSVAALHDTIPTNSFEPTQVATGWQIAVGVVLADFVLTSDGLIQDLSRNGVPLNGTVAAGDGTVYQRTADKPGETFTGTASIKVRAFRHFDDTVQVVLDVDNQTSGTTSLSFLSYELDGVQYPADKDGSADFDVPTRQAWTLIQLVTAPHGGGTLTIDPEVDGRTSPDAQIVIQVPALG